MKERKTHPHFHVRLAGKLPSRFKAGNGSVLISAAVAASVLAILAAGILSYQANEYNINYRAHRWNQAFHLAESAVEVGIAEFNYQYTQGGSGFQSGNGWNNPSSGTYTKTVSNLTDTSGNGVGSLSVTTSGIGTSNPQFTGVGTVTSSNYGGANIARAVLVTLAGTSSLFPYGIVSKTSISMANSFTTDSYNSTDPSKSTNGQYDSSKRQANGNVATLAGSMGAVIMANSADIHGTIATAPGGSVMMNNSAAMGPAFSGQATTPAQGVANGWITSAFTSAPPDVNVPAALTTAANMGTISVVGSGTMTISAGDYRVNSLSTANSAILTISGNVRLYVLGNVSLQNSSQIVISPNSSLTVYIGGSSANLANSGIVNNNGTPINNQWFGLPTMNSGTLANSAIFNGTFYAPDAKLTVANSAVVSGALVASNVLFSNSAIIHYDESLKAGAGGAGNSYKVVSWQELRNLNGTWVP